MTTIDRAMPTWHHRERHHRRIDAPLERVSRSAREVTPSEIRLLGPLMAIRDLPRRPRSRARLDSSEPLIDVFVAEGFSVLGAVESDREGFEVTLGAVGRFWRLTDNTPLVVIDSAEALRANATQNATKVAFDLRVVADGAGAAVSTETRVVANDARARRAFASYWALIRPFSGAIRRSWLAAIARRARAEPERQR